MQVTVFGASGRVGKLVVADLAAVGHQVTAFTHSSNPFTAMGNVTVVQGDISDGAAVVQALQGSDAVISCLGSWKTKSKDIVSSGAAIVVPAMETAGIKRLISLTGSGVIMPEDKLSLGNALAVRLFSLVASKILLDGKKHVKILQASSLDWTVVRSPAMTGATTKTYSLSLKLGSLLFSVIPRAAVAQALVDQLEDSTYLRQAPVIHKA